MKHIYLAIMILFVCTGCGTLRKVTPQRQTDSVKVEIRDRIVHDTVVVELPLIKEVVVTRDTLSHLENEFSKSDASVENGFLHHSLETNPRPIKVPIVVEVHDTTYIEKAAETIIDERIVEKELTKMQSFTMTYGKIAICITAAIVLFFLISLAVKIKKAVF